MHNGFGVHTAEGVLGGALGTLLLTGANRFGRRLPARLKPVEARRDPADLVVEKLEQLAGRALPMTIHRGLAQGLHWAHWISWGGLLGYATTHVRIRTIGDVAKAGAAMGAAVWAIERVGILPLARLTPPVHRQGSKPVVTSLLGHIAYGIACALPIYALDRWARRKSLPARALAVMGR